MRLITSGPTPASIMMIGEKPGWKEVDEGRPMAGMAGHEFDRMLSEAGINRTDVFVSNVAHETFNDRPGITDGGFWKIGVAKREGRESIDGKYPVDEVLHGMLYIPDMIERVNPDIIVLCGSIPLWAVLRLHGIMKWRGSILEYEGRKVIPTYNPAAILRNYPWRWTTVQDFRRVANESRKPKPRHVYYPVRDYIVRPEIDQVIGFLNESTGREIAIDIETRAGQISCIGISLDKSRALCIPFMSIERPEGYWSADDEVIVTMALRDALTAEGTRCVLHNGHYDVQYIIHQWGFLPVVGDDTMIMQHCAFPSARKSLDYISSLYCEYYRFWKDDGRKWNPRTDSEDQHWTYNLNDCTYTFECLEVLRGIIAAYGLEDQYAFQMSLFRPVLDMMLRGIRIDLAYRNKLNGILLRHIGDVSAWFETALGHPLNPDDNHASGQMRKLFYNDLRIKPILHRKTRKPTLDADALEIIRQKTPLLRPLIDKIEEFRSYRVFRSNFVVKALDPDDRMRSSISIPGTESFRFSSSENPFGRGANMQTIPSGTEKD